MDNCKPLAIVIGRLYTTRLTLVRAAGMVGCDVVSVQTSKSRNYFLQIDSNSKYVVESIHCPDPNEAALMDIILKFVGKREQILLLPADDWIAAIIDSHIDQLKDNFLVPNVHMKSGAVLRLMDKNLQKNIAKKIGMNVADGWLCNKEEGVYRIPGDVVFPCFVKPQESTIDPLKEYQKKCDNKKELEELLAEIAEVFDEPILLEEYMEITKEYGVQGASFDGRAVTPAAVAKELSRRGITATGKIFPIGNMPGLQEKVGAFLKETEMTGVFDMEFYECKGKLYFNEFNVRLGANGFALTYGVYNVPGLYVNYMLGKSDGSYEGPVDFEEKSFVSEKVVHDIYYEEQGVTFKEYKELAKNADITCIKNSDDTEPFRIFGQYNFFLPVKLQLRKLKKKLLK